LGSRVLTKNPRPWEFDDSLPEPVQETWAKISLTVEREDGGIVDAELIRPRAWVDGNGIRAGQFLPLNIAELNVAGFAHVTAVDPCPMISSGEGSVIICRLTTRQVDIIARAEILGADGTIEILEGTTTHPIWSLDRQDWVELGELAEGEQLSGQAGIAVVISHAIHRCSTPVYNIEVHGEHVYAVGELGTLVHNSADDCVRALSKQKFYQGDPDVLRSKGLLDKYNKLQDDIWNPNLATHTDDLKDIVDEVNQIWGTGFDWDVWFHI